MVIHNLRRLGLTTSFTALALASVLIGCTTTPPVATSTVPDRQVLAREALPDNDGWAAAQGGTWGGADAKPIHVYTVRTRAELVKAFSLNGSAPANTPKIVLVTQMIDLSVSTDGKALVADDFRDPAFSWDAYLKAYAPAQWGKNKPEGPLEQARQRSAARQAAAVQIEIPSNTTVIGTSADAGFKNGGLVVQKSDNVVLRYLRFENAYDHFPAWDPKDGESGEWNSEYDNLALKGASQVWIDHCTFSDGDRPDEHEPVWLGRKVQHHDGLLDITLGSSNVTVSWNHFKGHDKTTLVGGSDALKTDDTKLKVSFHHNWWDGVGQRAPRVRWGEVHVYNNLYTIGTGYVYSVGVGANSKMLVENNYFEAPASVRPEQLVKLWKGSTFDDRGNVLNQQGVDLFQALKNANPNTPLSRDISWKPFLVSGMHTAAEVPALVRAKAGAAGR